MNPRRKSRLSVVLFVLLGVAVASALVLYALRQNIDLFYTPSEVVYGKNDNADQKPEVGQRIRVGGMVVAGCLVGDLAAHVVERRHVFKHWRDFKTHLFRHAGNPGGAAHRCVYLLRHYFDRYRRRLRQ